MPIFVEEMIHLFPIKFHALISNTFLTFFAYTGGIFWDLIIPQIWDCVIRHHKLFSWQQGVAAKKISESITTYFIFFKLLFFWLGDKE